MTLKTKLMVSAAALLFSGGLAAAAPAIVADSVNLRAGPGPDFEIIAAMPAGVPVDVLGCEGSWCRVAYGRTLGFTDRDYLNIGTASVSPGYRTYGEGYASRGYDPDDDGGAYVSEGYTTGYGAGGNGERAYGGDVVRGDRAGVEVRGAEVRSSERTTGERRTSATVRTRGTEERGSANVRVDTRDRGARVGTNVNADVNTRTTTGAGNRGPRTGANANVNAGVNERTTTGAGSSTPTPNTNHQEDHGPNFIGSGARYRDNHP